MSAPAPRGRVDPEHFDLLYETSSDPWDYRSSEYERDKYAATLAALDAHRYKQAVEIGCSIGVFTEMLAPRCDRLVALDFSPRAVSLARERLASVANVEVMLASFPERMPGGDWDLVVCSEILYYLDPPWLRVAVQWLRERLESGATVLAVSWRGHGNSEPLHGDPVHDLLLDSLGPWHTMDGRDPGYRLDRFDARGR